MYIYKNHKVRTCYVYEQSFGNKNKTPENHSNDKKKPLYSVFYKLEKKITFVRNRALLTLNSQRSDTRPPEPLSANEDAGKRPGALWTRFSLTFYPAELHIWPAYRDGTERA